MIDRDGVDPMPSITPAGFQFLLMDIGSQVWYFMLQYLDTVEVRVISLLTHYFLLTVLGTSVHDEFYFTGSWYGPYRLFIVFVST